MRLQSLIKASFSKQTFSWMLISLPHLLLLCLSSTSLHLSPPLVLSPHLSAIPLPVLLPPLPLFFPSGSHLSCARRCACVLLAGRAPGIQRPVEKGAAEAEARKSFAPTNLCANDAHVSNQHIKEVPSVAPMKSIVVASRHIFSSLFFAPLCTCNRRRAHARQYVRVILPHVHLCLHEKSPQKRRAFTSKTRGRMNSV